LQLHPQPASPAFASALTNESSEWFAIIDHENPQCRRGQLVRVPLCPVCMTQPLIALHCSFH
jgi:hypothetical protein